MKSFVLMSEWIDISNVKTILIIFFGIGLTFVDLANVKVALRTEECQIIRIQIKVLFIDSLMN